MSGLKRRLFAATHIYIPSKSPFDKGGFCLVQSRISDLDLKVVGYPNGRINCHFFALHDIYGILRGASFYLCSGSLDYISSRLCLLGISFA